MMPAQTAPRSLLKLQYQSQETGTPGHPGCAPRHCPGSVFSGK
jgi:hypothetical protein